MKYCPSCQTTYADEDLRFCLQDGTGLRSVSDASQMPTQNISEMETVVRQQPVTSGWEQNRVTQGAATQPEIKKPNTFLPIILTALAMCVFFGVVATGWFLLSGDKSEKGNYSNINTNRNSNKTFANANVRNQNITTNSNIGDIPGWESIDYNASLNGERITYYRGTTPEKCQADCDANPACRGFALIRAGAYKPEDPPMCYLLSKVTGSVYSTCCIAGIKK